MSVFVLDKNSKPLMPCSEKHAKHLLACKRAFVFRRLPFVIQLKDRRVSESTLQPVRVKLDPGSKVTGIALVREAEKSVVLNLSREP